MGLNGFCRETPDKSLPLVYLSVQSLGQNASEQRITFRFGESAANTSRQEACLVKFPIATLEADANMMITTFATLINQKILIPSQRANYISVDRDHLVDFLRPTLRSIYVDTSWYVQNHPDVGKAISDGVVETASDHYVTFGFYEHRMPYQIEVVERWYLSQYPDVAEAVAMGTFASAYEHYYVLGFKEGRLPHANFTLRLVD